MNLQLIHFLDSPHQLKMESLLWRNSHDVAKFFQIPHIDEQTHRGWLKSMETVPPKTVAFFIFVNDEPVGVTYFHSIQYQHNCCDWGIYVHEKEARGKGIGTLVLQKCLLYAREVLGLRKVFLEVLSDNPAGIHLYEKLGFQKISAKGNVYRYEIGLELPLDSTKNISRSCKET